MVAKEVTKLLAQFVELNEDDILCCASLSGNPVMFKEKNIGKVQSRHVDFGVGKVQGRHVPRFLQFCLIEENQKKFLYFFFSKSGFRQPKSDMCQKKIAKVQPRHANFTIGKCQS